MFDNVPKADVQELAAMRELIDEVLKRVRPVKRVIFRTDIATLPCKQLVQRIIDERGEQAAAVLATKLNAELARRGKGRVMLRRAARNSNGVHVHG